MIEELKTLRDVLPEAFFVEFMNTPAAKFLDVRVIAINNGDERRWTGPHKNVRRWWYLENGKRVGWNENPARGWSFPVI